MTYEVEGLREAAEQLASAASAVAWADALYTEVRKLRTGGGLEPTELHERARLLRDELLAWRTSAEDCYRHACANLVGVSGAAGG